MNTSAAQNKPPADTANPPSYVLTTQELAHVCQCKPHTLVKAFNKTELYHLPGGKLGIPPLLVRAYLQARGVDYSFVVLAHVNMRGGVAKTTSTISLATRAAQYGFKTCILDLDSLGSVSLAFDSAPVGNDLIFHDIWKKPQPHLPAVLKRIDEFLYLLPSSLDNGLLDTELREPQQQRDAVYNVCKALQQSGFDLIVIDCPPALSAVVISTICAADAIIIPVAGDAFSFTGLDVTLHEIKSICQTFSLELPDVRILPIRYQEHERVSSNALVRLQESYEEFLLPVQIRSSTLFDQALEMRQSVFANARKSPAREDYDQYVRYLLGIDLACQQSSTASI